MNYEMKNYKKGLKLADSILKKFPEHGGNFFIWVNLLDKTVKDI